MSWYGDSRDAGINGWTIVSEKSGLIFDLPVRPTHGRRKA